MDTQMRRALLENCTLAVLRGGPSYGYRIVRDVSTHIAVTESTLYPILRRLESEGCLSVHSEEHNGRLRRYYAVTARGQQKLDTFVAEWEETIHIMQWIAGAAGERGETSHDEA